MEKINWKLVSPILMLILVSYVLWLDYWNRTGNLNGLGRGKKKEKNPNQLEIDWNTPANDPDAPTKIQLLTQITNRNEKALNFAKTAKQAKTDTIRQNALRNAREASAETQKKLEYLNRYFDELKGTPKYYPTII